MKLKETQKLEKAFQGDLKDYKSIPFWSWNAELDEGELVKQVEEMHEAGFGGFIMHARSGLKTEYLGEKWFSCIGACLKKAKELNMNAWVYDENGYPSGFVGGALLENEAFRAPFLRYEIKSDYDTSAHCVFKQTAEGYKRIYGAETGVTEYHSIYMLLSPANTDILNPRVMDEFILRTHEEYYKRFKDSFGKELVGFFTDEPQVYRYETPYSPVLRDEYLKRFGEDVDDMLVYLFLHDERGYSFRVRYFTLMCELYTVNFYKRLYDWCDTHGCKLTGHSVEEPLLYTQMWGGCGVMPSYEYEHIPAIDCLERKTWSEQMSKQVSSVAAQLGVKHVLTETFGCAGHGSTLKELKSIGEFQYFQGVNMMCQHLLPYTLAAQGKYDCPPAFSKHGNWGSAEMKQFNDYFDRLGYLVANTKEHYDALVIHPMRSIYLDYVRLEDDKSVEELENSFQEFLMELRRKGICYHFADERILERHGRADGDKIVIGERVYDTVIVPKMPTMSAFTYDLLQKYTGKLCMVGTPEYIDGVKTEVSLKGNLTLDEVPTKYDFETPDGQCSFSARESELGEYLFVMNYDMNEKRVAKIKGIAGNYGKLDLSTMEVSPVSDELILSEGEGVVLVRAKVDGEEKRVCAKEDITANFAVADVTENWFVLDFVSYSFDGVEYTEVECIQKSIERILRGDYEGKLYFKHTFHVHGKPKMKLVAEKNKYLFHKVNGHDVAFEQSDFDVNFLEGEITELLKEGENEFVYCLDYYQNPNVRFALFDPMSNSSLWTCLFYDTDLEPSYLKGEFVVNEDLSLSERTEMPPLTVENDKVGYPFFKGSFVLKGRYCYDGVGERILSLGGRFLVANVRVNGVQKDFVLDTKGDITSLLKKGENEMEITVKSSLRNLFGPHHWNYETEPLGVSTGAFTMRGMWEDGDAKPYTPKYKLEPFGVDKIEVVVKK